MGCSSSKLPTFPAASTADGIAPITPPDEFDAQVIKFIPQPGMFGNAVGVYLPSDVDTPTYFFQPKGGSYKLFKSDGMGGKEEMAVIKNGWQSSKGYSIDNGNVYGNGMASVTTSATLKLRVITKVDHGTEHQVKIVKTYSRDSGSKVEIDGGYSIQEHPSTNEAQPYLELTFNGNAIAYIYERSSAMNPAMGGTAGGSISDAMKQGMAYLKAPMAIYIKRNLLQVELVRALTIIATANDRLIRSACLDVNGGNANPAENTFGFNQYHHNDGGDYGGDYGGDGGGGGE